MSEVLQIAMTPPAAPTPPPRPPADGPAETVRGDARGTPVVIAGETWLLADHVPTPGYPWDEVYDQATLAGACGRTPLLIAAEMLLLTCHDLTLDQAVGLVQLADPADLAAAVRTALFGPDDPVRSWTGWVRAALLAAGLRPDAVPAADRRDVLDMLVATGRAVPAADWISSAQTARERAEADRFRGQLAAMARPRKEAPG